MTYLGVVVLNCDFLLTNSAPKLNSELRDFLLFALHAHDAKTEQSLLHVKAHLVVVGTHDTVETAESTSLHTDLLGLSCLANDLHDVVALALVVHVRAHKVDSVTECGNGSIAHIHILLLAPSTLNDGSQDGIGVGSQACTEIGVLGLANETDGGQGRLL